MDLSKQVLEANEDHKNALDKYSLNLQADLNAVDKLIAAVEELPEDDIPEDPGDKWCLHANGAFKPTSIIDLTQTLDTRSPFYADAAKRNRYAKATNSNPFSGSEKRYLEKAIVKENQRLAAIRAKESGQNPFEAVSCDSDFFMENTEGINWTSVARDVSASNYPLGSRTAQECRVRWLGAQRPKINSKKWSDDEEKRLHDLIESKEGTAFDWEDIAQLLDTNRSPLDCIKRFQARNRSGFRWTSAMDEKLMEAVQKHGHSSWALVASLVSPDVSSNQCQIRYGRSLNPEIKKGKFSPEEDERLLEAIEGHGLDWVKVAQAIPGRTNAQCRDRYMRNLTGGVVKAPWDQDEDSKLKEAVAKHGDKWDKVREEMGRIRSRTQYATRYRILTKSDEQDTQAVDPTSTPAAASEGVAAGPEGIQAPAHPENRNTASSTSKGKRKVPAGGRKKKAVNIQPEPQKNAKEDSAFQEGIEVSTMPGQQTAASQSKGKRGRKRKAPGPGSGLENGDTADAGPCSPKKRPRPRPRPTRTPRNASATSTGAPIEGVSSGGNHEIRSTPNGTARQETFGAGGADSARQMAMRDLVADLADLSDLTDLEGPPPPKKLRINAKPAKTIADSSPTKTRKSKGISGTSVATPKQQLPARTMRTRSSMKSLVTSENNDAETATRGEVSEKG